MFCKCRCHGSIGSILCAVSLGMFIILVLPKGILGVILAIICFVAGLWLIKKC